MTNQALHLDGADRDGEPQALEIPYMTINGLRVGRAPTERIDGRPALVILLAPGGRLLVASAVGLGMIHEMADRLVSAGLTLESPG